MSVWSESPRKRVIVLLGPTAVGKTAASLLLARRLETEIISADSMQVYRGMDIATAKPTPQERALVRHHLIDVVEPSERFSAGQYLAEARAVIEGLHERGMVPLVVGGTGLYVAAMTRGLFEAPEADERLRARLHALPAGELRSRLLRVDPEAAEEIESTDVRRMVRALEVYELTGEPITALRRRSTNPLPFEFIKLALTRDRQELYDMIEGRVEAMLQEGLVQEARQVLAGAPCETAMQAIGYKEIARYLQGLCPLDEAVELLKRNTRRYAKRQMTWFRKEESLRWVDVSGVFDPQEIERRLWQQVSEAFR